MNAAAEVDTDYAYEDSLGAAIAAHYAVPNQPAGHTLLLRPAVLLAISIR